MATNIAEGGLAQFGAILHRPWKADKNKSNIIVGAWAEDGTSFYLDVPAQLRDQILAVQNALAEKYAELSEARRKLEEREQDFARIFPPSCPSCSS
jgi:hypothetical protein